MKYSKYIDHTILKATATYDDILKLCNEAVKYDFKSVCVNPSNVSLAHKLLAGSDVLTCTVVGFPLGATPSDVKAYETTRCIADGADEIDMVINIGMAKAHNWDYVTEDIKAVVDAAKGVLVTVKVKAVEGVKAYYFTYNDSKFPNKNAGYIETTNEEINVGRLPGTTYLWVEDKNGKISKAETITIDNSTILNTKSPITKGTRLYDVLKNKGSSYQEFDKLIARTARAAGAYSKESAATVAVTLVSVLDKEYGVRIPYRAGGKYNNLGINYNWGAKIDDKNYPYNGMDCDGFTHWSYYNAGLKINTSREHNYWYWERMPFSKEKVEIGDIISQYEPNAHVKIVVGFTQDGIITAHANGTNAGVWINEQKYSSIDSKYTIIKGSKIASYYEKNAALGSGF